ncbi:MAG: tRNA-dihydrouridine synthase [Patescibacteria group bacterium]
MKKNFWEKINKPILALAPMAGITDSAFRLLCREFGADVVYTEMTSVDALYYDSKKTLEMLKFNKSEKPIVCQLFGKRPELYAKACEVVEKAGFSGIDINFGCPAKKVFRHGSGVALMKNLDKCHEIISTVLASTKLPVSIKIRKSIGNTTALDLIKKIKDLNVSAIMIHGRSYEKPFAGEIDYAMIKKAKKIFRGILLVNGGINSVEQAEQTLKKTGADGLGLARGLYGHQWLFSEIKNYLKIGKEPGELAFSEIKKTALHHAKLLYKEKGRKGLFEIRKHLALYVKGQPNASELRDKLVRINSIKEIRDIFKQNC